MSNKSGTTPQVVTLPTGGGALQGIGETFTPDPFTGTGNFTVPLTVPMGRNGFQPELSLGYSTGNGNGPFGLGWSLSVPNVSRKTSTGVPQYRDEANAAEDRDTFVFSGADDLVAVAEPEPGVTRFRPRTEGLFALMDRERTGDADTWRVSTRDGLVSRYGATPPGGSDPAVVADPTDRSNVFSWHLTDTTDPFGNRIEYEYQRDAGDDDGRRWDQLYLHRIRYVDFETDDRTRFLISVTFVYEERPDPISEHRAGFEIRTRLRCRRIEIRTHAGAVVLARTYELEYVDDLVERDQRPADDLPLNGASLLGRVRVIGHDGDATEELPPLDFGYSRFSPERQWFQPVEATGGALPPVSLADGDFDTVDLFGDALPDIVQMNGVVLFWRNRGDGRFDRPQEMSEVPAGVELRDPGVQFADMNGDGRADLLVLPQGGYFPLGFGGRWSPEGFVQYPNSPTVAFGADDLRLVDLDGDGVIDALRTGPDFELFFNDPQAGWDRVETRPRRPLAEFPDVTFSDPRVKLADLNGDGLQDIVLVDRGRIDYWPYLGHGNWGRRIRMESSPVFKDQPPLPEGFDPLRVLLGDLDGDGLDDIVYVQDDRMTFWINQGGERWSAPVTVESTPPFADIDAVRLTDLLGTGMNGLLWTSDPVPGAGSHYQFLDLTGGLKPYLLERMDNHMGAVTTVRYTTSTKFRLADEASPDTRWTTPLPFPVQVVERVEVVDEVAGGKLTNEFRYHQGYWDGAEREFRGFGLVDQFDSESFAEFHAGDPATFAPVDERRFSPPVLTRTWFHQGPVGEEFEDWHEQDRAAEFWPDDPPALDQVESVEAFLRSLPTRRSRRDALRALRGSVLRTELYALDDSDLTARPYTVTELAYALREESPPPDGDDRAHAFFPQVVAERTSQWERGSEPMTSLSFTDDHDEFGQPRRTMVLAVPRGRDYRAPGPPGEPYLGTATSTTFARPGDDTGYVVDRVARVTEHEVRNDGSTTVFELRDAVRNGTVELAVIGQTLTYYDGEAFEGLPLREVGRFGAPVRTEMLVLTEEILGDDIPPYLTPDGPPAWTDEYPPEFRTSTPPLAGYVFSPSDSDRERGYFVQQARHRYDVHDDPTGRGLIIGTRDPLGNDTTVEHDEFGLLPVRVTDPVALSTLAEHDYRVLQVRMTEDVNGNRTVFGFNPLGLLASIAVMGKEDEAVGDTAASPGTRFVYDLLTWSALPPSARQPVSVRAIRRVHHVTDDVSEPSSGTDAIETVEYSDGFGRLVQTRVRGEDVVFGDPVFGGGTVPPAPDPGDQGQLVGTRNSDPAQPNVVVSGWQVLDNKGRVVEKYEPFFATGWDFATPAAAQFGQPAVLFYEPRGQVVRTVNPDASEEHVVYGLPDDVDTPEPFTPSPWEAFTYDANDNAGRTHASDADGYEHHWNTPSSVVLDALGRTVLTIERTRGPRTGASGPLPPIEERLTTSTNDIRGNLLSVSDPLRRLAFTYAHDLTDRTIRTDSIDAGHHCAVYDAAGREIERRDAKGALILQAYDVASRPTRLWARDDTSSDVSLRERIEYGDGGVADQPPQERSEARAVNLLGALRRHYDEAGLLTVERRDFKGNEVERARRTIADELVLGVFPARDDPSPQWDVLPFRVDWEPAEGDDIDQHPARLLDPAVHTTSTSFDALNRIESIRGPAGTDGERPELRLDYDESGALERVTLDDSPVVERVAYDAKGQRTLIALGNGVLTRHAYDPKTLRPLRLRSERFTKAEPDAIEYQPAGAALQDLTYQHDLVGNLVDIVDRGPRCGVAANPEAGAIDDPVLRALVVQGDALVRRFEYDPLYRLVSAGGRECAQSTPADPWFDGPACGFSGGNHGVPNQDNAPALTGVYRQTFAYDAVGNLLGVTHAGAQSSRTRQLELLEGTNRLRRLVNGQVATDYAYDDNGNLVREATSRHFEWDHRDRLKAFRTQAGASEPSVHAQYLYDSGGERVKKIVRKQGGDVEVTTYVDGLFEHHRWRDGANTRVHVMDGEQRIAMVRAGAAHPDDRGPAVQFVLSDHLATSSVTVDDTGSFVNREEFTPYGETSFGSFARKRYRFCGQERDEESGLSRHGARYYAPWLARWASADPSGLSGGLSPYAYAAADPVNLTDSTGLQPDSDSIVTTSTGQTFSDVGRGTYERIDVEAQLVESEHWWSSGTVDWATVGAGSEIIDVQGRTETINGNIFSNEDGQYGILLRGESKMRSVSKEAYDNALYWSTTIEDMSPEQLRRAFGGVEALGQFLEKVVLVAAHATPQGRAALTAVDTIESAEVLVRSDSSGDRWAAAAELAESALGAHRFGGGRRMGAFTGGGGGGGGGGVLGVVKSHGSAYRRARRGYIRDVLANPEKHKVGRWILGWLTQEKNRGRRYWRNPPGLDTGHKVPGLDVLGNLHFENSDMNRARPSITGRHPRRR